MFATDQSPADVLSAVVLHARDAIIEITPDAEIRSWNAAAEQLYGYPAAEAVGSSMEMLLSPDLVTIERGRIARSAEGGTTESFFTTRLTRDGHRRHVDVTLAPIFDSAAQVTGLVSIETDITDARALEGEALRAERDAGVGRLAAGIMHEFNNVLTAIVGHAEFASAMPDLPAQIQDSFKAIRQRASEGTDLAHRLLAFGDREPMGTQPVSFGAVARELEPLARRLVGERIHLAFDLANDDRAMEVDRTQLELVILELISNASEAIGGTGQIGLSTSPVVVRANDAAARTGTRPGLYLRVTVQDSGAGMDDETAQRALEPGFTTKHEGHSGIGLTAAAAAVRRMGGRLTIKSTRGMGTTATVDLPLVAAAPNEAPKTAPTAASKPAPVDPTGNETILLVDDDTMVRDIVGRMLRQQGYTVIEARNGEDAIAEAGRYGAPIHLVLTDVMMPELNGSELFAYLRGWYPNLRVLFMSGYTRGALAVKDLKNGATGFIAKPFTMDQLAGEVRALLDTRK